VVNVVSGGRRHPRPDATRPDIDKISFTGSTATE
jgi:acyl-CoA reductase-like NAD-dependent aldehyde dehydrogenase